MFRDVQGCSRMFKDVFLSVPQVENSVCVHSFGMHKDGTLQSYTYKSVQHCTSLYNIVHVCTTLYKHVQNCLYKHAVTKECMQLHM